MAKKSRANYGNRVVQPNAPIIGPSIHTLDLPKKPFKKTLIDSAKTVNTYQRMMGDSDMGYIYFKLLRELSKTKVYGVFSVSSDTRLGTIKWYPPWRQYCFFPEPDTTWSLKCIEDVLTHIRKIEKKRQP